MNEFGRALSMARLELGITSADISKGCGLSTGELLAIETQRARISKSDVKRINAYLTRAHSYEIANLQVLADSANSKPLFDFDEEYKDTFDHI